MGPNDSQWVPVGPNGSLWVSVGLRAAGHRHQKEGAALLKHQRAVVCGGIGGVMGSDGVIWGHYGVIWGHMGELWGHMGSYGVWNMEYEAI